LTKTPATIFGEKGSLKVRRIGFLSQDQVVHCSSGFAFAAIYLSSSMHAKATRMKTDELRQKYLDFFESKGHTVCASDVMVPKWDKSVLFTPAGMNQFKDHFLGKVDLEFTRATTSQKCLRTGDIENVGRTAYHHTFFEMLGNFSFGDYFKRDAIHWAWEFLTDKKWLGFDPARLSVTVYLDDDEAADIWHKDIGLTLGQIQRLDEKENFWPASSPSKGPDGVCGPCSEIFFHPDDGPECEIWNLVFTQFNRVGDPPNNLQPLPSKNIDTGMGLERTAAVLQGASTNFHIDSLMPIVQGTAEVCGVKYEPESDNGRRIRRITDHIRACSLAIHENVYPGTKKEEFVVRLLLRRAVLQGYEMGLRDPFLYQLVPVVVEQLQNPYPELRETIERVQSVIKSEENSFYGLVERGIPRIQALADEAKKSGANKLDAAKIASTYQTYGVPAEIAESVAEENGLEFDWAEFGQAMDEFSEISSSGEKTVMGDAGPLDDIKREVKTTPFLGYDSVEEKVSVVGLINDFEGSQSLEDQLAKSDAIQCLVTDKTPFYAESGGQIGDAGVVTGPDGKFEVHDTQKTGDVFYHIGRVVEGSISKGEVVTATVTSDRRDGICRAHSATHILHYALQQNLGQHAQQRGSKVSDDHLRFDFANLDPVPIETLDAIEKQSNERIQESATITAEILPLEDARNQGAMMLFGEKYPDPVRMVSIGDFSKELCGGVHLGNSADVAALEIVSEENVAAGTRRIQALTGEKAKQHQQQILEDAAKIKGQLGVSVFDIPEAVRRLSQQVKDLKKQLNTGQKAKQQDGVFPHSSRSDGDYYESRTAMRHAAQHLNIPISEVAARVDALQSELGLLTTQIEKLKEAGDIDPDELLNNSEAIGDIKLIVKELPGINAGLMRKTIDQLLKKSDNVAALFVTSPSDSKVVLAAGLSRSLVDRGLNAGEWVSQVAVVLGGRGGGKPDFAQAGGKDPEKIPEALETAVGYIKSKHSV
jgi:alanyl-tRNA synthetase